MNTYLIGSVDTSGYANGVAVSGNTAFVVSEDSDLLAIDVSTPSQPKIIGSADSWGYAVAVAGNTAFVAGKSGLHVIDITTPSQPKIIGFVETPGIALGVAVAGNTAFVADFSSGLQVIDISTPSQPRIIGSVDTPGHAFGVAVAGNTAFVADGNSGLQVIDISTPSQPKIIGSVDTSGKTARGVAVADNTAFVADEYSCLQVIDISTPSEPKIIGSVYPYSPTGDAAMMGVAVAGNTAFVADKHNGLWMIDISIPLETQIIGSTYLPTNALGVAVAGNTAFVACIYGDLQVIDISMPSQPKIIGSVHTQGDPRGVAVAGNTAFVTCGGNEGWRGLEIMDINTPSQPKIIGFVETPGVARGVAVAGNIAFVADGDNGLQVIDVSVPSQPRIIGSVGTPGLAYGVAVAGNTAFVADGGSGLQVIDVSIPSQPRIIGSVDTPGYAWGVAVSGNTALVADYDKGLQVIDISTPSQPKIISSVDTWYYVEGVAVSGNTAFMPNGNRELRVIDISTPSQPRIIGSLDMPRGDGVRRAVVAGNIVFVADVLHTLVTIPLSAVTEIRPVTVKSETELAVTFPSPPAAGAGLWTLRVFSNSSSEYDEFIGAVTFVEPDSEVLKAKAVIVAARGGDSEGLWLQTQRVANHACKVIRSQGYDDERIYYLTSDSDSENFDALPTRNNLSYAVKEWSKDAYGLLLYFVGHGETEKFRLSGDEEITAAELNTWLNDLNLPGYTIFVYDACRSGSFISSLRSSGKNRVVVASTSGSDGGAWSFNEGYTSFSFMFWSVVLNNANLNDSFLAAQNQMKAYQTALLDADGDGIPNESEDKDTAKGIIIGRGRIVNQEQSSIAEISADQTLNGETSASLWASGLSFEKADITGVYAEIIPPDASGTGAGFPRIELTDSDNDGKYEGTYSGFTVRGTYTVNIYAEPKETADTISYPRQTAVTQTKGEDKSVPDSYEDDDSPGQAKVIHLSDAPQPHNFHEPEDKADWVRFYATEGRLYTIRAGSLSAICDVILELYDTYGSTKLDVRNGRTRGGDEFLDWNCPKDGVYFVKAVNANPDIFGENTKYELEIYKPSLPDYVWLQGKISDPSGAAIERVRVKTEFEGSMTDDKGEYKIFHSPGNYTLTAEIGGYTRVQTSVSLPCSEPQNIIMKPAENVVKGDIDGNGNIDLVDAILSLRVAVGAMNSDMVYKQADVNNDGCIGAAEAVYILRRLAG